MKALAGTLGGLWIESAERLRALEESFFSVCGARGYREVRPSLLLPTRAPRRSGALATGALRIENAAGEEPVAIRSDFTASVAWMVARRGANETLPLRLSYRGAVVRRPPGGHEEELELHQAGCERISDRPGPEGDEEVAVLAGEVLRALALDGAILELGHWGLVGPLLDRVAWPKEGLAALEQALNRKSVPGLAALEERHGRSPEVQLIRKLVHLGGRPEEIDALGADLRAAGVEESWAALRGLGEKVRKELPALPVRLDPTDVRHWSYYTGMTLKAFSPRHAEAVLSGGRYDASYPPGGAVRGACGFAAHLSLLVEES